MKLHTPLSFAGIALAMLLIAWTGEKAENEAPPKATNATPGLPKPAPLQSDAHSITNAVITPEALEKARLEAYLEGVRVGLHFGRRNPDMTIPDVQRYAHQLWVQSAAAAPK